MKQRLQTIAEQLVRLREDGAIRPEHDHRFVSVQIAVDQLAEQAPDDDKAAAAAAPAPAKKTAKRR